MVSPAAFIPLAEKSGLIIELGNLVLHQACRQTALWRSQGLSLVMSINLSPMQMRRSNMLELVKQALQVNGLPAHALELELTESMMVSDRGGIPELLRELRELGVTLAIDDFGTGYSNLGYLKRLDVASLKIDQSFIRGMVKDADSAAIVRAIIQMAESLEIKTVAEGIEDEETLERLQALGCAIGQGFYWSPALPPADFVLRWQGLAEQTVPI
jgi:EAL domain-containing protein (putative c-di-GMP-specific phosphodiesterase class I)